MKITDVKDIAQTVQAFATAVAILIGGFWTYNLFIQKREKHPKAKTEHQTFYKQLIEGKALLCLDVTVSNVGGVLLSLIPKGIHIRQILPLPSDWFVNDDQNTKWKLIGFEEGNSNERIEIEPGESIRLHYEFIVDSEVHTVLVYSHFSNIRPNRNYTKFSGLPSFKETPRSLPSEQASKRIGYVLYSLVIEKRLKKLKNWLYSMQVKAQLSPALKRKDPIGWDLTTMHDLHSDSE
jgi:hypothetical protein